MRADASRLECYDLIFRKSDASNIAPANKGNWHVKIEKSKLDDTETVVVSLNSDDRHTKRFGDSAMLDLILRCKEGVTTAYVVFAGEFMSDINGGDRVAFRIDSNKAENLSFSTSNNHTSLGLWDTRSATSFIGKLIGANRLFVRAVPFSESSVSGNFTLTGLDAAIVPLQRACKWPPIVPTPTPTVTGSPKSGQPRTP